MTDTELTDQPNKSLPFGNFMWEVSLVEELP